MLKLQSAKLDMFARVTTFGGKNRNVFPEESVGGKAFGQLAAVVASIEEQLVQRTVARTDAQRVRVATRRAVLNQMRAIAATGKVATRNETGPHPFKMTRSRSTVEVLTLARVMKDEAERRKEKFVELGMEPAFLTDFDAAIAALVGAVAIQRESRGARGKAQANIEAAMASGMTLVTQLDVTVANALRKDPGRLEEYHRARHLAYPKPDAEKTDAPAPTTASVPAAEPGSASSREEVLKTAS